MAFKAILLCAAALLVQSISGNCVRVSAPSCGCSSASKVANKVAVYAPSCSYSTANNVVISNDGGAFIVTGTGPVVPSGIAVASEIALSGDLEISGGLPFLSAVAFEGSYPTGGLAAVSYGCGDGTIGIQNVIGGSGAGLASIGGCGCKY